MSTFSSPKAALIAVAIVGAACSADRFAGPGASFFRASITGAVAVEYVGTGSFSTGTPGPGRQQFQVISEAADASGEQSFSIIRWDGGRLATGVHPIALVDVAAWEIGAPAAGQPRGLTVQYRRVADGWAESFVGAAGTLEITRSTREVVEGTFRFSGFRICAEQTARSNPPAPRVGPCSLPAEPIEGTPAISVTGSFSAVPSPTL
jgi:hypothetical protein